ncbi:MAG: hypothetical protein Q8P02_04190 [Candidatus Micrarchaeota archaeon]|nr:hypothetical protein [Candidatus Micrarchaeota archaeon]
MVDVFILVLLAAAGQALSWAFLPTLSGLEKICAGIMASLTVPAVLLAALNFAGVAFGAILGELVYAALILVSAIKWHMDQKPHRRHA